MNALEYIWLSACFALAVPVFGQNDSSTTPSEEDKAFTAITALMPKTRQGGENPSEQDLITRRDAGMEMAKNARLFLQNYPGSKKWICNVRFH